MLFYSVFPSKLSVSDFSGEHSHLELGQSTVQSTGPCQDPWFLVLVLPLNGL